MRHPVVINVVFHPRDDVGKRVAEAFVAHFEKIGMQRAGAPVRAPIRFRSEPLTKEGLLSRIAPIAAKLNVVIVLYGPDVEAEPLRWVELCKAAAKDASPLLAFVANLEKGLKAFKVFGEFQSVTWADWQDLSEAARARRLLIHVVNAIRRRLSELKEGARERIFLSHAKADGKIAAERVVRHMADPKNGLRLNSFYDASELETGEEWAKGLREAAANASMLALATDAYDERPWCNQEILWAKQNRRPLLIVDLGRMRVERSFPYSGNVTWIRDPLADVSGIEKALLELLSEALRCDLFALQAAEVTKGAALAYPRPPELADLAFLAANSASAKKPIVYHPALPKVEADLLARFAGGRHIMALSDYR